MWKGGKRHPLPPPSPEAYVGLAEIAKGGGGEAGAPIRPAVPSRVAGDLRLNLGTAGPGAKKKLSRESPWAAAGAAVARRSGGVRQLRPRARVRAGGAGRALITKNWGREASPPRSNTRRQTLRRRSASASRKRSRQAQAPKSERSGGQLFSPNSGRRCAHIWKSARRENANCARRWSSGPYKGGGLAMARLAGGSDLPPPMTPNTPFFGAQACPWTHPPGEGEALRLASRDRHAGARLPSDCRRGGPLARRTEIAAQLGGLAQRLSKWRDLRPPEELEAIKSSSGTSPASGARLALPGGDRLLPVGWAGSLRARGSCRRDAADHPSRQRVRPVGSRSPSTHGRGGGGSATADKQAACGASGTRPANLNTFPSS